MVEEVEVEVLMLLEVVAKEQQGLLEYFHGNLAYLLKKEYNIL